MSNSVINLKPINSMVIAPKPVNLAVLNIKPSNINFGGQNFTYRETRTIKVGQPIPWGLNWLITYPTTTVFQGPRL